MFEVDVKRLDGGEEEGTQLGFGVLINPSLKPSNSILYLFY